MAKNKKLLILVAFLVTFKILVMPQLLAQNDNLSTKEQLIRSNQKLSLMLATIDEEKEKVKSLNVQLVKMQQLIPSYYSDSQAKLAIQQIIEQYAKQEELNIQSLSWQEISEDENMVGLMHGKILLTVKGSLISIIRFQNLVAANQPAIIINSMLNAMPFKKFQTDVISRVEMSVLFQQGQQ